ncbi:MAG TPA: SWIM zinc finger family protein [Thermomicrobiales bacterium]|nr:SWIM zinc finger family protein [Thermomicrobiales bacterium]
MTETATTGADVRAAFKPLTEADIRAHTDDTSYDRGAAYERDGYISDTTVRGPVLRALCQGSSGGPYLVEATLAPADAPGAEALAGWLCSCPRGGFCKHIVALLLTWVHRPAAFAVRPELAALLAEKSREELLDLVGLMVRRYPDLADLVELAPTAPEAAPGLAGKRTVEPARIKGQIAGIFRESRYDRYDDYGWGAGYAMSSDLEQVLRSGDAYARAGQWANAQAVYTPLVEEVVDHYEELGDDEGGEIAGAVAQAAAGLLACLAAQDALAPADRLDEEAREELLDTLYDLWHFAREYVGDSDALEAALVRHATPEERARLERRLRGEIVPGQDFHHQWTNRAALGFLVRLVNPSDEEILAEYRRAALYADLAELLLARGRVDEAVALAGERLTEPSDVTTFADRLLALGGDRARQATEFVEGRAGTAQREDTGHAVVTYLTWLGRQYAALGLPDRALDAERRHFRVAPGAPTYASVKAAANLPGQPAGTWGRLRPDLLVALEERGAWADLVTIYLDEGEAREALTALSELERATPISPYGYGYGYGIADLRVRVARAAERDYPDRAGAIYQREAQRLIDQRGRENYRTAAGYLARVRDLHTRQGRDEEWRTTFAALRERHKSLRALKEELAAAGLTG